MILEALIGPVLGIVGGGINRWLGIKEAKANAELETLRGQNRIAELKALAEIEADKAQAALELTREKGDADAFTQSQAAQYLAKSSRMADVLSAVRPALTLLALAAAVVLSFRTGASVDFALNVSWNLASVAFGWWFGDRSAARLAQRIGK
jgi:hypothetical protein